MRIVSVVGTRPQLIKAAAVVGALAALVGALAALVGALAALEPGSAGSG